MGGGTKFCTSKGQQAKVFKVLRVVTTFIVVLLYCCIVLYCIVVLLYCCIVVLCCRIVVLLYCIVILLYCRIVVLLYCGRSQIFRRKQLLRSSLLRDRILLRMSVTIRKTTIQICTPRCKLNKTGSVRITLHQGAFTKALLPWKKQ